MADHHHPHHHHHPQQQQSQPQPPSGFWTLTKPNKLSSKRRNSDLHELHHKVFNIAVVGLSGVERDKGPLGIGKSCLCNRFVRSAQDDYHTDHISCLSQSDFGGRVVNNDHWLYWGSVIKSCDGCDLAFNIIEQTEFVDDSCFQPFKSDKTEPYYKRCASTKLNSAEKLMYICKNQLGIEREYEQRYLPDGKFTVDGFLCLFDVSEVQGRNVQKQIELTNLIMLSLLKTKKPIVFVTTKHDEANELMVMEAERLINQRDFRGIVPIVETSAQENININMAFLVCAQLIDKTRTKLRVPSYFEAYKNHQDLLNAASDAYLGLIQSNVHDFRASWQQVCIKLSHNPEFLQYTYLHGLDKAALVFKNHLKRLRDESVNAKIIHYLKVFPDILNELIPINTANNSDATASKNNSANQSWETIKEQIKTHPSFDKYFIFVPPEISWYDTELLYSPESRIPSDWLDSQEAFSIFQQRNIVLETEQKRKLTKEMFAQMLTDMKIPVGKPFIELKHVFVGNPDFLLFTDQELFEVYVEYQNNLLQKARADFQELLLENAEHLHHLTSSNKVIRQEDIKTINAILQHDERYHALDRFDQDRTLMMIRHLSFLHSQISEQCPSYPKCVEPEIERLLITKAKTLVSRYFETKSHDCKSQFASHSQKTCDLIIFGPRRPSQQLILALNVLNSRAPKESQYQITFTVFDNADEIDIHVNKFKQSNTKPKGCFGIFTNQRSLEHVSFTLEKFLILTNQMQNEKNHFGSPPVVMLYAADITLDERTMLALENDGQQVADKFKCPFMNVTAIDQYRQHQQNNILTNVNNEDGSGQIMSECASLDYACVDAAFNVLKEAVSRKVCFMELYNNQDLIPRQAFQPDARILMCLLCGEPFSNEQFLWKMFLNYEDCYVTSSKSICLKIRLSSGQEKFIEVIITSYTHGAFNYREDLLHGFMLVCSIQRKASISILNAFSFNIPCTPVLVIAIKNNTVIELDNQDKAIENTVDSEDDESEQLMSEAKAAANRLKGHFEPLNLNFTEDNSNREDHNGIKKIKHFLHSVIKRKPTIERAYELGDNDISLPSKKFEDEDYLSSRSQASLTIGGRINDKPTNEKSAISGLLYRGISHNQPAMTLSGDEASNDNSFCQLDRSDESDPYATLSNVPLSKLSAKLEREDPSYSTIVNELYATRPLPPIPKVGPDATRNDSDRATIEQQPHSTTGAAAIKLQQSNHSKFINQDASNQELVSSTDDDTEDSTDYKNDKPKPGKLDLRQFDNITNAIGKLNIQPPTIKSSSDYHLKHSTSTGQQQQPYQEQHSQESGFFKKKTKGSSNRAAEGSTKKESGSKNNSSSSDSNSRSNKDRQEQLEPETIRIISQKTGSSFRESKLGSVESRDSNNFEVDNCVIKGGLVKEKSSLFKNEPRVDTDSAKQKPGKSIASSTFLQSTSSTNVEPSTKPGFSENKVLPKPAPRSARQPNIPPSQQGSKSDTKPITSISNNAISTTSTTSTSPPVASTVQSSKSNTVKSSLGTRRLIGNNLRQNHGRAVAPPQAPTASPSLADNSFSETVQNEIVKQLSVEESGIDLNQSPIAQRLLQHSKDHKVSELNSPYESDNEQSNFSKKLLRGQSLNSESSTSPSAIFTNSSIDSSELINSRGAAIRQLNDILANKQPPSRFGIGGAGPRLSTNSRSSSLDQQDQSSLVKKNDKDIKKIDKKKLRDDEKMEKRRLKEEERIKRQEKKMAAKKSKSNLTSGLSGSSICEDGIPLFIKRCIEFIELEGLDAEGIYRVPGNRAHVDAFVQKFKENPDMSIVESDIPVNAVATALKDFLSKKWGPIIPTSAMNELTEISSISDRQDRVKAVRSLIKKLPPTNYNLLKYVFSHFVKVSLNHSLNSMDSKNLAICWWPTLLPLQFDDMVMFEQMRPHLEDSIQTMIDRYDFIFDSDNQSPKLK